MTRIPGARNVGPASQPLPALRQAQRAPETPVAALDALTPVQREAVIATATAWLREPEELAAEWFSLLYIDLAEEVEPPAATQEMTVPRAVEPATNPVGFPALEPTTTSL